MTWYERIYPKFVSALGSVGLGTAIAYFVGIALLFRPGWEAWADVFLIWGPPLAFVPGLMLIAHLYLRTHLGRWWVERGQFERAIEYVEDRLEPGILRSRRETLYHRLYLARSHIGRARYDAAIAALTEGYSVPETGVEAAKIRRWQLEAELRIEDATGVEKAFESGIEADPPQSTRAALNAGRAEWAVLAGSSEAYHTHMDRARWADEESPRVALSEGFGAVRFGGDADAYETGLERLDSCRETASREVPGRTAEIDAVRAQLLGRLGRGDEARRVLDAAERAEADPRGSRRVEHVSEQWKVEDE